MFMEKDKAKIGAATFISLGLLGDTNSVADEEQNYQVDDLEEQNTEEN